MSRQCDSTRCYYCGNNLSSTVREIGYPADLRSRPEFTTLAHSAVLLDIPRRHLELLADQGAFPVHHDDDGERFVLLSEVLRCIDPNSWRQRDV